MIRYDLIVKRVDGCASARVEKHELGSFVKYVDVMERIAELKKERDKLHNQIMVLTHTKEFDYVDDPQFVTNFNNIDIAFQVHSLEQQAKGVQNLTKNNAETVQNYPWVVDAQPTLEYLYDVGFDMDSKTAIYYAEGLLQQAKALKEQG